MRDRKMQTIKDGFTLVEVLVTVVLLATILTGALMLFVQCTAITMGSQNLTFVMDEAQTKMDEIRNSTYSSIVSTYHSTSFNLTNPSGATGSITVTEVGADTAADLLQVDITVNFDNVGGRDTASTLSTLIANM